MVVTNNKLMLYRLKSNIENHPDFNKIDKILYLEFCRAIKNFPDDIDEYNLFCALNFFFSEKSKMILVILISKLGNEFFSKDDTFICEVCCVLESVDVCALFYHLYAKLVIDEPIYSLLLRIEKEQSCCDMISLLLIIVKHFNFSKPYDEQKDFIIKTLHRLLGSKYQILVPNTLDFSLVYQALLDAMIQINSKMLTFLPKDFILLKYLLEITDSEKKEIILDELLECERNTANKTRIIRGCLNVLKYHKKNISIELIRNKKHE